MAEVSPSANDTVSDIENNPLQQQAVQAAKAAFSSLNDGSVLFQQCLESTEPISTVVQGLLAKHGSQRDKKCARILENFQKYTVWLQNMAPAVDVAVNASSGIACPVWAPIKYILKLSKDHFDALERILRMIETVSDCLPRLRIYEKLNEHPALQTAFLQLFTSIINFSVVTLRYLNRNAFARVMRHVGKDFESEFGDVMDSLRRHARAVDDMAIATELQQAARHREKTERVYRHDLQIRCSEWLRPSNVREVHARQLNERLAGTCQWILENLEFSAWSDFSASVAGENRLLLICGNPGCGKSVLASSLVEHVESQTKNVLFFPFSNVDATRETIKDVIQSFIWQALVATDEKECWETIHRLMSKGPAIENSGTHLRCTELDGLLRDRIPDLLRTNENLRVVILGRPQILQHQAALPSSYLLQITPKMVKEDIKSYVSESVNKSSLLRGHRSKALMEKTLRKQSEGMFLWVRLIIQDLQTSSSAAEARQRLDFLPRGLAESYRQVLRRIHDSSGKDSSRTRLVRNVLAFTVACRRPLSYQELRYALAMDIRYRMGRPSDLLDDFLPQYSAEQLVDLCANLISISNNQVLLIHTSLKEFIRDIFEKPLANTDSQVLDLCLGSAETHGLFAKACLEYLQVGDYGLPWQDSTCLPDLRRQNPFLEYASKNLLYHISSTEAPGPSVLDEIVEFIQSGYFASWVEHFHLDLTGDFVTVLLDFDEFMSWVSESSRENEVHTEIRAALDSELRNRLKVTDMNNSSTERWMMFTATASEYLVPQHLGLPGSTTQSQADHRPSVARTYLPLSARRRLPLPNVEALAHRTIRLIEDSNPANSVRPRAQLDMVLNVLSIATLARKLTDPLDLLFKLLLQRADTVPVYALYETAKFYSRIGQEHKSFQVLQSALKKVAGSDTTFEFKILDALAEFHYDRYEYEQAIPYIESHISGLIRQRGRVDSDVAEIKILLGKSLEWLDQLVDSEAIFLELLDLESRSHILTQEQISSIYVWMQYCRCDSGDYEGAISWFQKKMKLPNFVPQDINYEAGTYMGSLLHSAGRYEEALAWFENLNKLKQKKCPKQENICNRRYCHGITLYNLEKWDESFTLLRQTLAERNLVKEAANLPEKMRIVTKETILTAIFYLGHKSLLLRNYQLSLNCFLCANQEWASSRETDRKWPLYSSLGAIASLYGLGDIKKGLQQLRGIQVEFLSYYRDNWGALLEFKYLIGYGAAHLNNPAPPDTTTDSSSRTLPPFGLKKQRSLDSIWHAKTSMARDLTGIGLAASLVTLISLVTQGCTRLHDLQGRYKNAPSELNQLVRDADVFKVLLGEIERSSNDIGSADLSPELRSIWRGNENQMRDDLKSFTEMIEKLQLQVDGSGKTRILGRIRSHIEMLNFIQSLLTSRQISHVHATLGVANLRILGRLDRGIDLIEEELSAIHETLSMPQRLPTSAGRELFNVIAQSHNNGSFQSEAKISLDQIIPERKIKRIYWKWAMYQLPIGTLTTEVAHSEGSTSGSSSSHEAGKTYNITFKFQPPLWLTGIVFQLSHTIKLEAEGHKLPYWQRTQCGAVSLLPVELSNYLGEGDFLAAGACLSKISACDILRLCDEDAFESSMFHVVNRQMITSVGYGPYGKPGTCQTTQQLILTFTNDATLPRMRCPKIHISYEGALSPRSLGTKTQHEDFVATSSTYRLFDHTWDGNSSLESTRLMLEQFSESNVQLPRFCISISRRGLQSFKNYICQHFDPLCCSELSDMDRWWMGALLHSEPSLRTFLSNHFASFRSPGTFPTLESSIPEGLRYDSIVQEVLSAPLAKQDAFVMFLCAFGTDQMLNPFIMKGGQEAEHFTSKQFLRAAVISRNCQTYDILYDALEKSGRLQASLDLDLLTNFLNWDFLGEDSDFIDDLTEEIPPTSIQNDNPSSLLYQYATKLGDESSKYVMGRLVNDGHACFCHPPFTRELYLGPEVLKISMGSLNEKNIQALEVLLNRGASVDFVDPERYEPSMTALQAVVHQGNHEALSVVAWRKDCMANPETSLFDALRQAENHFAQKHPRKVSLKKLKTDLSERCHDIRTHSVDARADAECCLTLAIILRELGYLPEAECASRIKAIERFYSKFSHPDSDGNSVSETDSDSNSGFESDSSSNQVSDDQSEEGNGDRDRDEGEQLLERSTSRDIDNRSRGKSDHEPKSPFDNEEPQQS
ncbi:hypothetical protein IFR05_003198 [Cadophora sp. M221]|nr:hypothetical protein IFR05_003198 [Cadophora sp. M221]